MQRFLLSAWREVERPIDARDPAAGRTAPRTLQAAQHVAAGHFAFGDTCTGKGLRDIPGIAAELPTTPIWTFWWD